ncbi:uncharacterized protein M6B38_120955 [Iris pallida]|uniref:Uncharacterized protein n=1 Tax=Iris pallida TaxID=29817 RepID=A0AAX6H9Q7_IRIPA|nr:uncharacterized protein M6B38_150095 [Iris pallida]KAJ6837462.1 uncharacterized protein M6B38_120955 [Iris pallida]
MPSMISPNQRQHHRHHNTANTQNF